MKVAFLGNTNNHPFHVAKYFKDQGHDVIIYIDASPKDQLHRPEALTYGISYPYPSWIIEERRLENSLWMHFPTIFARDILKELNTCDAVVMNHYAHRFIPYLASHIIKICMFTGGDLETMADYSNVYEMKMSNPRLKYFPAFTKKAYARFSVDQLRQGIRNADLISYFPTGLLPLGDRLLEDIFDGKPFNKYEHWAMFIDGIDYVPPPHNPMPKIVNVARFMWSQPFPPGTHEYENKRNDIMLEGIGQFIKESGKELDIHLIEKGLHVKQSKDLIASLGYEKMVTWHKEMPMKDLLELVERADIIFDQLGKHLVGAGIFGMLKGRPLIANARPEILGRMTTDLVPICNATTPEEVSQWLVKLTADPLLCEQIGLQSHQFARKNFDIKNQAKYFLHFIELKLAQRQHQA